MTIQPPHADQSTTSRRNFLKASTAAVTGAALAGGLNVHAAGSDILKVGIVGCGGRGSGAASQAMHAEPNVKLVAMADMFKDRLDNAHTALKNDKEIADKIEVKDDRKYVGFDAYKQLIDSDVDVVLLATPPGFRPIHLTYAIEKGKHVFTEKPMAVDAPGVRKVLAAAELAKKKNLSLVSGFVYRYHAPKREMMKRIHGGDIGDIVALQCTYNTNGLWSKDREKDWTDMHWQLRNWLYFTWLSGDHIVEQAIHSIDKMNWAMQNQPPKSCIGVGGRQVRTAPEYGHIFDHFSVVYEYANGVKMFHQCRQQNHCKGDVSDFVYGTKGTAALMAHKITGANPWHLEKDIPLGEGYQTEHNELFASIRAGKPINDGEWMMRSTLMGIMGRMAAYTGQQVTWEQALNSKEDLSPARYEFGQIDTPPVAMPGQTKLS